MPSQSTAAFATRDVSSDDKPWYERLWNEATPGGPVWMARSLPNLWDGVKAVSDSPNRIVLKSDVGRAVVRKDFDGEPKNWLTTFFEPGKIYDQPGGKWTGGAAVDGPTSSNRLTDRNLAPFLPVGKQPPWMPSGWSPFAVGQLPPPQAGMTMSAEPQPGAQPSQ